jgi:hypothetical protein
MALLDSANMSAMGRPNDSSRLVYLSTEHYAATVLLSSYRVFMIDITYSNKPRYRLYSVDHVPSELEHSA